MDPVLRKLSSRGRAGSILNERERDLERVRQVLKDNNVRAQRMRSASSSSPNATEEAESSQWLEREQGSMVEEFRYTLARDQLAIQYQTGYHNLVKIQAQERTDLATANKSDSREFMDIFGPPNLRREWENCPNVQNFREAIASPSKAKPREKNPIKRIMMRIRSAVKKPFKKLSSAVENARTSEEVPRPLCNVCFECQRQILWSSHEKQLSNLYAGHCTRARAAYDEAVKEVGASRLHWHAPQKIPPSPNRASVRPIASGRPIMITTEVLRGGDNGEGTPTLSGGAYIVPAYGEHNPGDRHGLSPRSSF